MKLPKSQLKSQSWDFKMKYQISKGSWELQDTELTLMNVTKKNDESIENWIFEIPGWH